MGMETKQPAIGDRLVLVNSNCEPDRFARVIAKRETRFGIDWEIQLENDPSRIDTISRYVGTAEDRGGYAYTFNHGGIGAYLIVEDDPNDLPAGWAICETRGDYD